MFVKPQITITLISVIIIILFFMSASFAGWTEQMQLTPNHVYSSSIAANGSLLYIMSANWPDGRILYFRSSDYGHTWGTIPQFADTIRDSGYPPRLTVRDSVVCAVWDDGTRTFMGYSTNNGQFWRFKYDILRFWYDTLWGLSPGLIDSRPFIMCNRMYPDEGGEEVDFNIENMGDTTWGNPVSVYPLYYGMDISTSYYQGVIHCLSWCSLDWNDLTLRAYYLRSTDLGQHWSSPINIRPDSSASAWSPKLTINERGELITCYMDARQYEPYDSSAIVYRISDDNGLTWANETQVNVRNWINVLSIGWSGNTIAIAYLAFSGQDIPSEAYCVISNDNGTSWLPEYRLTNDSANTRYTDVAVSHDTVYVIYYSDSQPGVIDRGLYFRRYNPEPQEIRESTPIPSTFGLATYPNPFNSLCQIKFSIPQQSRVTLDIYDILGRKIITLLDESLLPGEHTAIFNATGLSSGIYFCRIIAGLNTATKSIALIK